MALNPDLIRESFALVEPVADKVSAHFYALLFTERPELREMFPPMMDGQRGRLVNALVRVVHDVDTPDRLLTYLHQLGADHRKFGVRADHYPLLYSALITAMRKYAGPAWRPDMDDAWLTAYQIVANAMIAGANEAAKTMPPWWTAQVVAHEHRGRDIAVITLRPDQPLPYHAGQYVSVETSRWPRVWRFYSIANAPRADGTITLHVRALDAGWVSNALVNHTEIGDQVRLGPAVGNMVCNTASARDVLCVAGGTGLAPLKAIVEHMGSWNTNRRVELYFGARTEEQLYDLDDLNELTRRRPWLTVIPATSHDRRYLGERGMLPDVLAAHAPSHGNWANHDVYVSGSADMVRNTVGRLLRLGVPANRIRFDAYTDDTEVYVALDRAARQVGAEPDQASKSSSNASDSGVDWQARMNLSAFSSGSRA
jgi:NAD(P)H-flavin reductase/hemoglobin-like flavoprotein